MNRMLVWGGISALGAAAFGVLALSHGETINAAWLLAAQFGFLPGTLWLVIGVVLGGAVQDFTILFCSLRRDGKSLGQMAKEEINRSAGITGMLAVLFIMIILLAVLALIVVNALKA